MRIVVTGRNGQIARSLSERAESANAVVTTIARPEFDLQCPDRIFSAIKNAGADLVVAAAAYTAVDLAESESDIARATNVVGSKAIGEATRALSMPVIYLSTDYVFDGSLDRAYREDDAPRPINVYGETKHKGEQALAAANPDHAIVRTAWVHSPFSKNFVRTMLTIAANKPEISVVGDQVGTPTSALEIADGLLKMSRNILTHPDNREMRGIFHMAATGVASWAKFAEAIFETSAERGGAFARVHSIPSSAYPTLARRPANSRLDVEKIACVHGVVLPDWRGSVGATVARLIDEQRSAR